MNEFNHSWSERISRRTPDASFRPPDNQVCVRRWHMIETHKGAQRMEWRAGIFVWHDVDGERWTDVTAHQLGWRYIGIAGDQSGGKK